MNNINLNLYCNTHSTIDPLHTQANQKTLVNGASLLSDDDRSVCLKKNYILDNTFQNISSMNPLLGDLTGLYWVWKNTTDEWVGVNQYCRFYDDDQLKNINYDSKTIYVSHFVDFGRANIWEQYSYFHTDLGIKILVKAIEMGTVPITIPMMERMLEVRQLSTCNSFFAHRQLFNKLCEVLFNIIFELYEGVKYCIEYVQLGSHSGRSHTEKRLLAFMAERILTLIYYHSSYFLGSNVVICPVGFYHK